MNTSSWPSLRAGRAGKVPAPAVSGPPELSLLAARPSRGLGIAPGSVLAAGAANHYRGANNAQTAAPSTAPGRCEKDFEAGDGSRFRVVGGFGLLGALNGSARNGPLLSENEGVSA
jgi:hypothetical protein